MRELKPFIQNAEPFVFGTYRSLSITTVQRTFTAAIKKSGVKPITIHDLRHSHATLLINAGVNIVAVSKRLGHSSINITLKTYAHLLEETEEDLVNTIDELRAD
jgi:integrase